MEEQQLANEALLHLLSSYLKKHPELRFIQALWNLNIVNKEDRFYENSPQTLMKVMTELKKGKQNGQTT